MLEQQFFGVFRDFSDSGFKSHLSAVVSDPESTRFARKGNSSTRGFTARRISDAVL
jgi:hypothetical protein